jgi:hypothetical protein
VRARACIDGVGDVLACVGIDRSCGIGGDISIRTRIEIEIHICTTASATFLAESIPRRPVVDSAAKRCSSSSFCRPLENKQLFAVSREHKRAGNKMARGGARVRENIESTSVCREEKFHFCQDL